MFEVVGAGLQLFYVLDSMCHRGSCYNRTVMPGIHFGSMVLYAGYVSCSLTNLVEIGGTISPLEGRM